ncbi:MAG: hypothetical protein U9R53_08850 [Chloroflexota bacterium]|nr:hypothetical protein [Chloroflexota bacterium]
MPVLPAEIRLLISAFEFTPTADVTPAALILLSNPNKIAIAEYHLTGKFISFIVHWLLNYSDIFKDLTMKDIFQTNIFSDEELIQLISLLKIHGEPNRLKNIFAA